MLHLIRFDNISNRIQNREETVVFVFRAVGQSADKATHSVPYPLSARQRFLVIVTAVYLRFRPKPH